MAHSSLLRQALTDFADRPLLILPDESNIDAGGRWEATPSTVHACTVYCMHRTVYTVLHAPYIHHVHRTARTGQHVHRTACQSLRVTAAGRRHLARCSHSRS